MPGVIMGTPAYMSPEQAKGKEVDGTTDVWAFGCVLYEMLTRNAAFGGETTGEILAEVSKAEADWRRLPAETPEGIRRLLRRCLQKDPKRRLHDIADARIELDDAFAAPTIFAAPIRTFSRRVALAIAALVVAGLLATWIIARVTYGARAPGDGVAYRALIPIPEGMTLFGGAASPLRLALSSDGQQLAFVVFDSGLGLRRLWVRRVDEAAARPLAGTEGADTPFWSPDGRFIAYRAQNKLWKINVSGGPPLMLADSCAGPGGAGGAWNRDDVILFTPKAGSPLHRIAASGGTSFPVTKLDTEYGEDTHRFPFFLPDGQHFLYLAAGSKAGGPNDAHGAFVGSLDPSEPRKLLLQAGVNAQYALGHLIFMRDGTLVAQPFDTRRMQLSGDPTPLAERIAPGANLRDTGGFAVSATGALLYQSDSAVMSQLGWFDRAGKQLATLGDPADQMGPELSPDGTRVAVSMLDAARNTRDIWIYDVSRGLRTRFTTDPTEEVRSIWAPDGSSIAFSSQRKGSLNLYRRSSNGIGTEEVLIEDGLNKRLSSWSPDGRFIAYGNSGFSTARGDSNIWLLPLFGDRKPRTMHSQTEFVETPERFSPDGRWLAYNSNESGRREVYIEPIPGPGGKVQVSTAGGSSVRWRRDSKELFYLSPDNKLMTATVNEEGTTLKVDAVRPLFEVRPRVVPYLGWQDSVFDVSSDGQRFLINTAVTQTVSAPINLVVNWPALLKK
jgi:eukaryotic-like serine/threonine-protein kinase